MRQQLTWMAALALVPAGVLAACGGVDEKSGDVPAAEAINPTSGPPAGGTTVTITGSNFEFDDAVPLQVVVGSTLVAATATDDSTLTFVTPPGPEGLVGVNVFHGGGAVSVAGGFRYGPVPTVTRIDPEFAPQGATVEVTGSGFERFEPGAIEVVLGQSALSNVTVLTDTRLTGTVGTRADDPFAAVDVTVRSAYGEASLTGGFRYTGPGLLATQARNENRGRWFYIDPTTARAEFFGNSVAPINKITVAQNGDILVVAEDVGGTLGLFNPIDLSVAPIAPLGVGNIGRFSSVVLDGTTVFAMDKISGRFKRFNATTGALISDVALVTDNSIPNCIFVNNATTLFYIKRLDATLDTVNKVTGAVGVGISLNGPPDFGCHGVARIGSDVFLIGYRRLGGRLSHIFRLDTTNGNLTDLGEVRFEDEGLDIRGIVPTPTTF